MRPLLLWVVGFMAVVLATACHAGPSLKPTTADECERAGHQAVPDIGNGETQQPEYRCPSGEKPISTISFGIEGGACCPRSAQGK